MNIINLKQKHINDLLDPKLGATVVTIDSAFLREIQKAIEGLTQQFTQAKSDTLTSNYSYVCLGALPMNGGLRYLVEFSKKLADELTSEISRYIDLPEQIEFDDLYLTKYQISEMGVGPHRDVNCKNFVMVLVLEGTPAFYVCEEKNMKGSVLVPAQVGDLMIMRAKKFLDLPAPLHYVGAVKKTSVLQLGMRQYISRPKK